VIGRDERARGKRSSRSGWAVEPRFERRLHRSLGRDLLEQGPTRPNLRAEEADQGPAGDENKPDTAVCLPLGSPRFVRHDGVDVAVETELRVEEFQRPTRMNTAPTAAVR
jgi:hypothetical protein